MHSAAGARAAPSARRTDDPHLLGGTFDRHMHEQVPPVAALAIAAILRVCTAPRPGGTFP